MANVISLASLLRNQLRSTLVQLAAGDCHISSEGAVKLQAALHNNSTLKYLDLGYNPIGVHTEGISAVTNILLENKLQAMFLNNCSINGQGSSELAAALCKNSTLKDLYLGGNSIGVEGASAMSDMLQRNRSLTYIDLRDDSIGKRGVASSSTASNGIRH